MEQKTLSKWLKIIIIGCVICGLIIYGGIIPILGKDIALDYQEFAYCYYPWLLFIWVSGIPCYIVLLLGWNIATRIGNDQSFCIENAKGLKNISILAATDSIFVFVINSVYLILNMNHPGIVICSLFVVFAGVVVSVVSAALSHLVKKASDLQEQSELTI